MVRYIKAVLACTSDYLVDPFFPANTFAQKLVLVSGAVAYSARSGYKLYL